MDNPIKPTVKTEILPILFLTISLGLSFYFYANFPEKVALHWNYQGVVDGYSNRVIGAFSIPAMLVGIYFLFLALPYLDPKKERYLEFAKVYHLFKGLIIGLLFLVYCVVGAYNLGCLINVGSVMPLLVGLMFILMGNYFGKIKNNWFIGIRTPWTLSSENVWNKTHRLSGWLFIIFGAIIIISPFLPKFYSTWFFFGGIIIVVLVPMIYSYILYQQEKK